ncbi:DNA-binding transcriptional regulator, MarR family [Parapedobacter composti]|uniref:DNA-binding transcriptional regulator, MarR family n=1 Tax=Parapedobacter composti TaxID=623281 RepID=A0A1I1L151_9SPHI|nr:MarR family transcriptional regulator [Parapedobacter composti]SFC64133.1 DNA-binding transcriptional regulator, MarR family [Parapedobacter composti]
MEIEHVKAVRKLSQLYTYTSLIMHEAVAKNAGLSGTDQKYLALLLKNGKMTAGALADLTGLTTGAVTGLVDRFERKQLVKREFDQGDRRKVVIAPDTERIRALLTPLYEAFQSRTEALIASFSKEARDNLETYFRKAIILMNEITDNLNEK